jgi:hypothetical protein
MKGIVQSMRATIIAKMFDREGLVRIVDGLAIALAVSLPWSTTATEILAELWFLALIPTLDHAILRRVLFPRRWLGHHRSTSESALPPSCKKFTRIASKM